jgi:hypothetical protein
VSRIVARSRLARLAPRLMFVALATASVVAGAIVGCGIDYEGSLVVAQDLDASENVGAMLPPEGGRDGAGDGSSIDAGRDADAAPPVTCASSPCVDAGGGCNPADDTCTFHCEGGTSCATGVRCPPGVACRVLCNSDDSCAGKIDCTQATSCDIACLGARTCEGIDCAGTSCAVRCNGDDSCRTGGIRCTATDVCDIVCAGPGKANCKDPITCKSSRCGVRCDKDGCTGGVTAIAGDASIFCGDNACEDGGATCFADICALGCKSGACKNELCCDAGICLLEGGTNNCP